MALTKKDLSNIEMLIKANTEPIVSNFISRFGRLERYIDEKFEENTREHNMMMERTDNLFKTENEDVTAIVKDVDKVKAHLKKFCHSEP